MKAYLNRLIAGEILTREDTHTILLGITQEKYNESQIAALLMALQTRGVTVDELLGFRDGLLETGKYIDFSEYNTLDIVGTGGDGKNTFNISTCSSFVIAGAGYKVTKHGNGGSTSVSGASNVLQGHGARFTDDPDILRRSLDEAGICYFHAPLFAYGMKFVGPTRRALGVPTCFNLLGPLVNPCHPKNSLHGTANQSQLRLYVSAHQKIGDNFGVITSYDGYDEISLTSGFKLVTNDFEKVFTPKDMGFNYVDPKDIYGGETAADAMKIFDSVLEGTSTEAQKNVILANAACGIAVLDRNKSIEESIAMARESLDSGKALAAFKKYLEING
ncbi:MAG: anthranilate phosphoribosyltransferase [Bacteroidales bacterium]|nr:anthranilate phosphoribosyltransferase [Bacteroidales bacterium]